MNKLSAYLANNAIKQADFAAVVGVEQATISRLARGAALPSLTLAISISRLTGGAVPVESWVAADPAAPDRDVPQENALPQQAASPKPLNQDDVA